MKAVLVDYGGSTVFSLQRISLNPRVSEPSPAHTPTPGCPSAPWPSGCAALGKIESGSAARGTAELSTEIQGRLLTSSPSQPGSRAAPPIPNTAFPPFLPADEGGR